MKIVFLIPIPALIPYTQKFILLIPKQEIGGQPLRLMLLPLVILCNPSILVRLTIPDRIVASFGLLLSRQQ